VWRRTPGIVSGEFAKKETAVKGDCYRQFRVGTIYLVLETIYPINQRNLGNFVVLLGF